MSPIDEAGAALSAAEAELVDLRRKLDEAHEAGDRDKVEAMAIAAQTVVVKIHRLKRELRAAVAQ